MQLKMQFILLLTILAILAAMMVYSFKRCGWGAFAYQNAFIAALTKECAQQQQKILLEALQGNGPESETN